MLKEFLAELIKMRVRSSEECKWEANKLEGSSLAQPGIKREINEQRNKTRSKKIFDRLAAIGGQRLQST